MLQELAGPCSHTQGFGGGGLHLSFLTCQMGALTVTVSSSQLEDSNAWKGPWHVVDLSVSCCWSL